MVHPGHSDVPADHPGLVRLARQTERHVLAVTQPRHQLRHYTLPGYRPPHLETHPLVQHLQGENSFHAAVTNDNNFGRLISYGLQPTNEVIRVFEANPSVHC